MRLIFVEKSLTEIDKRIIPNAHIIKKDHKNWLGIIISKSTIKKINDFADLSSDELIGGFDEVKGKKIPFNDKDCVLKILNHEIN